MRSRIEDGSLLSGNVLGDSEGIFTEYFGHNDLFVPKSFLDALCFGSWHPSNGLPFTKGGYMHRLMTPGSLNFISPRCLVSYYPLSNWRLPPVSSFTAATEKYLPSNIT